MEKPLLEGRESDRNDLSCPCFHLPHLVVPGLVGGGTSDRPPKNSPCWQQRSHLPKTVEKKKKQGDLKGRRCLHLSSLFTLHTLWKPSTDIEYPPSLVLQTPSKSQNTRQSIKNVTRIGNLNFHEQNTQ